MKISNFENTQERTQTDGVNGPPGSAVTTTGPQKPKKGIPFTAIGAIVALLVVGLFWRSRSGGERPGAGAGGPGGGAPRDTTRTVRVMQATSGTLVTRIEVTGTLRANQNVDLNSKISGRVERVLVNEGDRVRRGQLLVQLETSDLRSSLRQAQSNLRASQARLLQAQVGLPARVAQVNTSIEQARATLATAQARYRQAVANEPAQITQAQSQVDVAQEGIRAAAAGLNQARTTATQTKLQTEAAVRNAEAGVAQAQAQLEQARTGSRAQEIARAEAQVNLAQAQLRDAETNLNRQRLLFEGGATAKANVDTAQTNYDVAKANLEAQQQALSLVRAGTRTEEIRAAEEVVRQREAALSQAQAGRGDVLRAQSAVTTALTEVGRAREQLRQAQAGLAQIPVTREETRVAREEVGRAQAALRQAIANRTDVPVANAEIEGARAAAEQAAAQVEQAELNLAYANIYSPVNGVVTAKATDGGESAAPGTSLLTLVALDSTYFEAQIPESQLAQVRVNQPAQVVVSAVRPQPFTGYVSEIIRVADERLRQFRVRITVPNSNELTPGAFARGTIQTNIVTNALIVPDEVIKTEDDNNYIMVTAAPGEDGKAKVERRNVKLGASQGGQVQILSGLKNGDSIITGNAIFEDGDTVRIAGAGREGGGEGGGREGRGGRGEGRGESGTGGGAAAGGGSR